MAIQTKLTLAEYCIHDDGSDRKYELNNGELVMVPPPSPEHSDITDLLSDIFKSAIAKHQQSWLVKRDVGLLTTNRDRETCVRIPDLCVLTRQQWSAIKTSQKKSSILETVPLLVVEIVSPGEDARARDYVQKYAEYENLNISEYWIVDRVDADRRVTVFLHTGKHYQKTEFRGSKTISSSLFPNLDITAEQILAA